MADVIERIEDIRVRNNGYWMDLLRIAVEADPQRTKQILARIEQCDSQISGLLRELAEQC